MTIKNISTDMSTLTPQDIYALTLKSSDKMQEAVNQTISVRLWALCDKEDSKGEVKEVLTIISEDGKCYGTISSTFIRSFFEIVEMLNQLGAPLTAIKVTEGISKSGRSFIDCELA